VRDNVPYVTLMGLDTRPRERSGACVRRVRRLKTPRDAEDMMDGWKAMRGKRSARGAQTVVVADETESKRIVLTPPIHRELRRTSAFIRRHGARGTRHLVLEEASFA
jgi:hypothetical protein